MTQELKNKWLEALRSGEYKQDKGILRSIKDNYCCLGVLCDISGLGTWIAEPLSDAFKYMENDSSGSNSTAFLPAGVLEKIKMTNVQLELASMNDCGIKFSEIADWIEKNV
jgi:hypothetical protein